MTTLFFDEALLPDGWARQVRLTIRDGLIAAVERDAEPAPNNERHGCALPGMPNLHSHAFQRGMAGLGERRGESADSFWTWREVMYRFLDRLTPDDVRAIAALAYVEMLEAGFARVGEFHYLHHDRDGRPYADIAEMSGAVAAAAGESGIALTLLPVLYSHSGFGALPPTPAQARFVNDIDAFARLVDASRGAVAGLPDSIVGVAPHSLRAVSPEQLAVVTGIVPDAPVHLHIAEQTAEVEACLAWSGRRPVEWLLDQAEVDARWCLIHATHMTAAETAALARSGATVAICPVTEANLGDGLFPAAAYAQAGGAWGIGTDSNVAIDCAEELRLLEYGQRLAAHSRNVLAWGAGRSTGADLYAAALDGGAALGATSGIRVGAAADIVSLDRQHPSLIGRNAEALIDGFVFSAGRAAIDCVWRRGAKMVAGGRHRARDTVAERYRVTLERLLA